jgi:hypothetical protein
VLGGDAVRVPLVAFVPVQPPAAAHEVALVEDQVMVEILPEVTLVGLAEIATVGSGMLPPEFPPPEVPPGYALFDPGNTGTPPGTSMSTILTLEVTIAWSEPSWTTLVPVTRSVIGMVTAWVRGVNP